MIKFFRGLVMPGGSAPARDPDGGADLAEKGCIQLVDSF